MNSIGTYSPPSTSCSPSPNLLPTPISSWSSSERSFSGVSSLSTQSSQSNLSSATRSSSFSTTRRRGYIRPQGATFAQSAKNRESVMSLGSIAHLQYYFARTGLLDGKGGQLAKTRENGEYDIPRLSLGDSDVVDSPIEEEGELMWQASKEEGENVMLPPTVSTYSQRRQEITPPPDQQSLKKGLVEALENALQALESCESSTAPVLEVPTQGFYEIQGLHILDTTTLAIRAARLYYTLHPSPTRLNQIKADYEIRRELYDVLEVLKKFGARNFTGGLREDERLAILVWVSDVGMMIDQEAKIEEKERTERRDWYWMDETTWKGRPLDHEMNFLRFLLRDPSKKGVHEADTAPGKARIDFFRGLADGRNLISMHNAAVEKSKKRFGQITKVHEDINKPYRRAENLRFWLKAAEIRWEVRLKLDVMGIVNMTDSNESVLSTFEDVVLQWSKVVREELTRDWNAEEERKLHARAKSLACASPRGSPKKSKSAEIED